MKSASEYPPMELCPFCNRLVCAPTCVSGRVTRTDETGEVAATIRANEEAINVAKAARRDFRVERDKVRLALRRLQRRLRKS